MRLQLIYLDTTIWNILAVQAPDGRGACTQLSNVGLHSALGLNAYFEKKADPMGRGIRLFKCVYSYLEAGVPLLKSWEELLLDEAAKTSRQVTEFSFFSDAEWSYRLLRAARELSEGQLHPDLRQLIERRDKRSGEVRESAAQHMTSQPDMLAGLQRVTPDQLESFLAAQSVDETGQGRLAKDLEGVFDLMARPLPADAHQLAKALLANALNKVALAVVRNAIYYNWRAARSMPSASSQAVRFAKCIPDDSYHVVNACYCDAFVTEDKDGQAVAAHYVVPGLRAFVYEDRKEPILRWLARELTV